MRNIYIKIIVAFSNLLKSSEIFVYLCCIEVFILFRFCLFSAKCGFCIEVHEYHLKLNFITSEDEGGSFSEKL